MVCNLTIVKKIFAEYEDSVKEILVKAGEIEEKLLSMIDEDAKSSTVRDPVLLKNVDMEPLIVH